MFFNNLKSPDGSIEHLGDNLTGEGEGDVEHPAWAAAIGDRPAEPALARDWDRAAALAAAYREQFAITDETSVLGPQQPAKGTQSRAWAAADEAVRAAGRRNHTDPGDPRTKHDRRRDNGADSSAPRPHARVGDRDLASRLAGAHCAVALTGGQLVAMTRQDLESSTPVMTGSATVVRERSRHALQQQLTNTQLLLHELSQEHQHRQAHPEDLVPDTADQDAPGHAPVPDSARAGTGSQGRVRAATEEPVRVSSLDMAAEEAAQPAEAPPTGRLYAAVGDYALASRVRAAQAAITLTGGQLKAMTRRDQEREAPLVGLAAKMQERTRRAVQRQLDRAQTELREMTEEELLRSEHPELSIPDTAEDARDTADDRLRQSSMDVAVERRGPAM